jgi:hypothetical protein
MAHSLGGTRSIVVFAVLAGCGRGGPAGQVFTRQVPATPPAIVRSAVTTFSDHGVAVAVADEPAGRVRTAPVNLRASSGAGQADDRLTCPAAAGATAPPDTAPVTVVFELRVKPVPGGSIVALDTRREDNRSRCGVKSSFVAQLLDEITQGTRR